MRRYLLAAAQAVVSIGLLAWLFRNLDWRGFLQLFWTLPLWFVAVSLGIVLGGQVLYAWRWWRLLDAVGVRVPVTTAIRLYFVGIFLNNFAPGTIGGDISKVYFLGREHGYRPLATSIVVDRVLGVGILATFAALALWLVPQASARAVAARLIVTATALVVLALSGLVMSRTGTMMRMLRPLGTRAVAAGERVQELKLGLSALLLHPGVLVQAVVAVGLSFGTLTLLYLWFARLNGLAPPSFASAFGVVTAIGVLTNVPISLNGLGVREQLHVWLFVPIGIPADMAMAISLMLFCYVLVASAIGLVFWRRTPAGFATS